jgi:hypothetical protein
MSRKPRSQINETGLLRNTISNGMGLEPISSVKELIDNSLDADAKNIHITFDKIQYLTNDECVEPINTYAIIVSDDGKGMNKIGQQNFLETFLENQNKGNHGKYGIGGIASCIHLSEAFNPEANFSASMVFTNSKNNSTYSRVKEIIIDWKQIEKQMDKNERKIWTDAVSSNNIDEFNKKYIWEKYKLSDTGTIIVNVPSKNSIMKYIESWDISGEFIQKLCYQCIKSYYYILQQGCNITISDNISETMRTIEITQQSIRNFDPIHFNKTENIGEEKLKVTIFKLPDHINYLSFSIETLESRGKHYSFNKRYFPHYRNGTYRQSFKLEQNEYDKYIQYLKSENKSTKVSKFEVIDNNDLEAFNDTNNCLGHFILESVWLSDEDNSIDSQNQRKYLGSSVSDRQAGLYFVRNSKVLTDPISLDKVRTTQTHTKWRSACKYSNPDTNILDKLIKPMINKSKLSKESLHNGLRKVLSLTLQWFVGFYLDKGVINKPKIDTTKVIKKPTIPLVIISTNSSDSELSDILSNSSEEDTDESNNSINSLNDEIELNVPIPKLSNNSPINIFTTNNLINKKNYGFTEAQKKIIKNRQHNKCNNFSHSSFQKKYKFECPLHSHPIRLGHWDIEGCEVDHIIPKHLGGENDTDNGQALCLSCHAVKTKHERSGKL